MSGFSATRPIRGLPSTGTSDFAEHGVYVSKLEMGAHSGTHVDAPMHFLGDECLDVARMPLERFMGEAIALDTPKNPGEDVTLSDIQGADIRAGDIVLFRTGWETRVSSPAFFEGEWPGLRAAADGGIDPPRREGRGRRYRLGRQSGRHCRRSPGSQAGRPRRNAHLRSARQHGPSGGPAILVHRSSPETGRRRSQPDSSDCFA